MQPNEIARLDTAELLKERFPDKKFSSLIVRFIRYMICEKQINQLFVDAQGKKNIEFVDSCMKSMKISCNVVGEENLPTDGRKLIFAGNHPQGGIEAICIAHILGNKYDGKIKFYANEFLSVLEPLREIFLPIYKKTRLQHRENVETISDFYESDCHLITFPAGVTSSQKKGKIVDQPWRKSFIKSATKYHRDIVPLYFNARNSHFFYFIENFRKSIHSPINFEVSLFAKELFKQCGKSFTLYIGKPMSWELFDNNKSVEEWAYFVRETAYSLPEKNE